MTNNLDLSISFAVISIAVAIVYFVVLIYTNSLYKKNERLSLRNSYGYEFYASSSPSMRGILYTLISIDMVSLCMMFLFYGLSDHSVYTYCVLGVFLVSVICLCASNMIPLSHPFAHLSTAYIGMGFMGVGALLSAFSDIVNASLFHLVDMGVPASIIMGFIGSVIIIALFNPKLRNWAKYDKSEVDGMTVYVKPKVNWLALYEWIALILYHVIALIMLINIVASGQIM